MTAGERQPLTAGFVDTEQMDCGHLLNELVDVGTPSERCGVCDPVPAVADDPACVCAMTSIRNCPVHGQGPVLLDVPANKDTDE